VSALLLEDALLKCVVTEVALFSIVAFKTLNIEKSLKIGIPKLVPFWTTL